MEWSLQHFGVNCDCRAPPFFSTDSKRLLLPLTDGIALCSSTTGKWIRRLDVPKNAFSFPHPKKNNLVCAINEEGFLHTFDINTAVEISKCKLTFDNLDEFTCLSGSYSNDVGDRRVVICVNFENLIHLYTLKFDCAVGTRKVGQIRRFKENQVVVGNCKDPFYFCIEGRHALLSIAPDGSFQRSLAWQWNKRFKCVYPVILTAHPNLECVAIGWKSGIVTLLYDFMHGHWDGSISTFHWHAYPVESLAFSPEANYLYSGGSECVLVRWELESGQRNFITRLGSSINGIACSEQNFNVCIRHEDNAVRLINGNLQIERVLSLPHTFVNVQDEQPIVSWFLPKLRQIMLNTRPGHLQFINVDNEISLTELDVTQENRTKACENGPNLFKIEAACVCEDDKWLACAVVKSDKDMMVPIRDLHLFRIARQEKVFRNIASIKSDRPSSMVISMRFGSDGKDRQIPFLWIWTAERSIIQWDFQVMSSKKGVSDETTVLCKSSLVVCHPDAGMPASICFSGAMITCAFEMALIFYDMCKQSVTRTCPVMPSDPIRYVECIDSERVLSVHKSSISLWHNEALEKYYEVGTTVQSYSMLKSAKALVYSTSDGQIFRFDVLNWTGRPIACVNCTVRNICFYQMSDGEERVLIITDKGVLMKLYVDRRLETKPVLDEEQKVNRMVAMLHSTLHQDSNINVGCTVDDDVKLSTAVNQLLKVHTFLMPKIQNFCSDFLNSISPSANKFSMDPNFAVNHEEEKSKITTPISEQPDLRSLTYEQILDIWD